MSLVLRILCGVIAVILAVLAFGITASFYSEYGRTAIECAVFVTLAGLSLAIKLVALPAAAGMNGHRLVQVCLWFGFGVAVLFDSFGVAGWVEATYGSKSGASSQYARDYEDAKAEVGRLRAAADKYAAVRATAIVAAELKAKTEAVGRCSPRRVHTDECQAVATLETERANAETRDAAEKEWRDKRERFESMKRPDVAADPQAAVIAKTLGRLGFQGAEGVVSPFLSFVFFVFFEVVAPALSFVAFRGGPAPVSKPPVSGRATGLEPRGGVAAPAQRRRTVRAPAAAGDYHAALRALRDGERDADGVLVRDGKVTGSQRALGAALGISGARFNRALKDLKATGAIAFRTSAKETVIDVLG